MGYGMPSKSIDSRRKIYLYYHDDVTRDRSGTSQFIRAISDELSKHFSVDVFVYGDREEEIYDNGRYRIHVVKRPNIPLLRLIRRIPVLEKVYNSLVAINPRIYFESLAHSSPDGILCIDSYCGLFVSLFAKLRRIPVIFRPNDCLFDFGLQMSRTDFRALGMMVVLFAAVAETLTLRNSDLIIASSEVAKSSLDRFYHVGPKSVVWAHTISSKTSREQTKNPSIRSKFGIPQENKVVLFLGTADWFPNTLAIRYILRELAPKLADTSPDATILIVGQGTEKYRSRVACNNVVIVGTVPDIHPYLETADIGIAPLSVSGGVNIKLIDYLSSGLVCLATERAAGTVKAQVGLFKVRLTEFDQVLALLVGRRNLHEQREAIMAAASRLYSSSDTGQNALNRMLALMT